MMCLSPEREKIFAQRRQQYGSVFAFHGSEISNWHSILRNGLYNASNTNLMSTGAVFGPGIYLSPDINTSWSYTNVRRYDVCQQKLSSSHSSKEGERYINSSNAVCIALCEVINDLNTSGDITIMGLRKGAPNNWQQPDDQNVVTRFLFIYNRESCAPIMDFQTTDPIFDAKCRVILTDLNVL